MDFPLKHTWDGVSLLNNSSFQLEKTEQLL